MKSMKTPRTRAEFERNFNLLHRKLADGKFHIMQGLSSLVDGLTRVRYLPNGRIDFLSIDESARLTANMMNDFDEESLQEQINESQQPIDESTGTQEDNLKPLGSDGSCDSVG
jgi:hypothetical protein